jgi:hypothetical protein
MGCRSIAIHQVFRSVYAPESIIPFCAPPPPPALSFLGRIQLGLTVDIGGGNMIKRGVQTKTIPKKLTENVNIIQMYMIKQNTK